MVNKKGVAILSITTLFYVFLLVCLCFQGSESPGEFFRNVLFLFIL